MRSTFLFLNSELYSDRLDSSGDRSGFLEKVKKVNIKTTRESL